MVVLSRVQTAELQARLQKAVIDCSSRGLYQAAKWAAELLNGFGDPADLDDGDERMEESIATLVAQLRHDDDWDAAEEERECQRFLLAKSFFDCREFDRCAAVFIRPVAPMMAVSYGPGPKGSTGSTSESTSASRPDPARISRKSLFLALYAKYLAGEKRKDEESEMILGPADGGATKNKELGEVASALESWFGRHPDRHGGGWLEYLYGVVLAANKNEQLAKTYLIESVNINPYNWAAWDELANLLGTHEHLIEMVDRLPQNVMTVLFHVYASQELFTVSDTVLDQLTGLQALFPRSDFLRCQQALLFYHLKDFESSWAVFTQLIRSDPYRLDSLDVFSNVLYVLGNRPMLTFLAQLATVTNKFRPETCCIVGNYYSLLSDHEKATMYFRRALTLDRSFSAAWTLMGHEYVEMKNTHAAIESYRRAIEANRRDYRAWYGLGQTYEFLEMQIYALFYYQRAASLRPFDPKMWAAIGTCYARTGKVEHAIKAYKRALVAGSSYDGGAGLGGLAGSAGSDPTGASTGASGLLDPDVLYQIALLYERLGDIEETASYMELVLAQEDGPEQKETPPGDLTNSGSTGDQTHQARLKGTSPPTIPGQIEPSRPPPNSDSQPSTQPSGVGVTPTTSKARMWLAKREFARRNLARALRLATELCQDGVDVDEAKALVRDIQARVDRLASSGHRADPTASNRPGSRSGSRTRRSVPSLRLNPRPELG